MGKRLILVFFTCFITFISCVNEDEYMRKLEAAIEQGDFAEARKINEEYDRKTDHLLMGWRSLTEKELSYIILNNTGDEAYKQVMFVLNDGGYLNSNDGYDFKHFVNLVSNAIELSKLTEDTVLEEGLRQKSLEQFKKFCNIGKTQTRINYYKGMWINILPVDFDMEKFIKTFPK